MQTKQLMQFVTVARAGNISEAAKILNIAQPALSQSILTFEKTLGADLFIRHRRGVELTEAGKVLYEHASTILEQLDSAREAVREIDSNPSGSVTVGLPASVSKVLINPICQRLTKQYPNIRLQLEEGLTGNLVRWLRSGRIDLIVDFDSKQEGEFKQIPLIEEDLFLIGSSLTTSRDISFKELEKVTLILPSPEHGMSKAISRLASEANVELRRYPITLPVYPMLSLVRSGEGFSILPWSLIYDLVEQGDITARRIRAPKATRTASLVIHKSRPETKAMKIMRDVIIESSLQVFEEGRWRGRMLVSRDNGQKFDR